MKALDETNLLTIEQLSEFLQVPKGWIYRQTRERSIPFIKMGKYLRFDKQEIEAWLEKQKMGGDRHA